MMPSDAESTWFAEMEDANPDGSMIFQSVRSPSGGIVDFTWLYSNPAASRIVHRPAAELLGRRLLVEMPGNKEDGLFDAYVRVVETGQPFTHEFHYAHEGLDHWFQSTATRFRDGFIVRFADITQKHRMEQELRARETLFRTLTENLPDLVARLDRQGRHLYVSPRIRELADVTPEFFLGKTQAELWTHGQNLREWEQALATVFERGERADLELAFPCPEGFRYFHSTLVPERDASGSVVSVLAISREVTQQRLAEEARHESEQRLRMTLEAANMGTWDDFLPTGERKWDARCREIFGLSRDEPIDIALLYSLIHPEDRPRVEAAVQATLTRGEPFAIEHRVRPTHGGPERWVSALGHALPDRSGRLTRFAGIMVDITERRKSEDEMRRMAEFEQQLLGIVGHDLRNPLSAILTSAALLEPRLTDERSARAVARIVSSTKRATRIIHDLLDLTHARVGGGIPIQPGPANIHALVRRIVEEHEASYPDRRLELAQRGPGDGIWDTARLEQVVANLLSNALSYSPTGSPVRIETDGQQEEVRVLVHNAGPPIPRELLPHLFQPFKRANHELERRGSMGLGLFIVEQVIQGHRGRIEVSSTAEDGTRFTIWLPRAPGEREPDGPG